MKDYAGFRFRPSSSLTELGSPGGRPISSLPFTESYETESWPFWETRNEPTPSEILESQTPLLRPPVTLGEQPCKFREYIPLAWTIAQPAVPYKHNWHIDCIAEHLQAVSDGELLQLLITIPPREMKSLLVGVFWPTWEWLWAPGRQWLCASYDNSLSLRDAVRSRRLMQHPWYREQVTVPWTFSGDQNVKGRYENDLGGHRIATSVGGMGTGEGGDRLVVDDPHNVRQAESEPIREGTVTWWKETMTTRANDPATCARIVVQQRTHTRDLAGVLIDEGGWHHLNLPARYERRTYALGTPKSQQSNPHDECPIYPDPRQAEGELLDEARFPEEQLARQERDLGQYGTASQFQQRPGPREGSIFKASHFRPLPWDWNAPGPDGRTLKQRCRRVAFWDLNFSAKQTSDFTASLVLDHDPYSDRFFVSNVWRDHVAEKSLADTLVTHTLLDRPQYIGVWSGAYRAHSTQVLLRDVIARLTRLHYPIAGQVVPENTDKEFRAQLPANKGAQGQLYADTDAAWWQAFLDELLTFPRGAHDDQVDVLSGAMATAIMLPFDQEVQLNFSGAGHPDRQLEVIRIGG